MTTCLELTGHQRVVSASLGEDGEVEREESEVDDAGDESEKSDPGDTVHQQVTITQILPRQQTPEILSQEIDAEDAGVDSNILDTEISEYFMV